LWRNLRSALAATSKIAKRMVWTGPDGLPCPSRRHFAAPVTNHLPRSATLAREAAGTSRAVVLATIRSGPMANLSIPSLPGAGGRSPRGWFGAAGLAAVAAAAILLYIISPFYTVGEYERTVVTRFGQFHSLAGPGLHFRIPFVNGLETFPIGIQRMQKDHLNTYTVDNQELDALVTLNFRIPEAEVRRVFTTNRDYRANLESFMIDRFKREMGKINITQVAAHRGDVALSVQKSLETEALSLFGISIVDFQINDIRYTEQYRKAVDSAAIAKAKVEQS
jgi:hypothetical protein